MNKLDINKFLNIKKIEQKEALIEILNQYTGILNKRTIDYLRALIELEFNAVSENIESKDREILSTLNLYLPIVSYNIYNRLLNMFSTNEYEKIGNNEGNKGLSISYNGIHLVSFSYSTIQKRGFIGSSLEEIDKMSISLYNELIIDKCIREKRKMEILKKLNELYKEKNPYGELNDYKKNLDDFYGPSELSFGGPQPMWHFLHLEKINKLKKEYNELNEKINISPEKLDEVKLINKYHNLLLEEFGLNEKSFEEEKLECLEKILTKRMPKLEITDNIKYI